MLSMNTQPEDDAPVCKVIRINTDYEGEECDYCGKKFAFPVAEHHQCDVFFDEMWMKKGLT